MLAVRQTLEISSAKVLVICWGDVEQAAAHGITGPLLFSISMALRSYLWQDVEENEGHNSRLKKISERAPHIGVILLAARANLKKALGLGSRGSHSKCSKVRPLASEILSLCIENHVDGLKLD